MTEKANLNGFHLWRYLLVLVVMLIVGSVLSYRALSIQVLDNDFLKSQGDARHLRTIDLPANRGMILDRNDEVLAMSTPVSSVWANPRSVDFEADSLRQLANLIDRKPAAIKRQLADKKNRQFVYLRRHINPGLANDIRKLNIPGISLIREFRRFYPTAEVGAHVVGFTDIDDKGQEGIELRANPVLQGKLGKERVVRDLKGHIIESIDLIEKPNPGGNLQLSIDKRLQYIAYRELKNQVHAHAATSGSLVLLDVHTGEVLAMVNEPTFNPNNKSKSSRDTYRNRVVTDLIEPGSTIKPFVAAAALKSNQFSPSSVISTAPGYMRVGDATIHDVHNYGELDLSGVIKKSSNVGITKVALQLDRQMLWETLSDIGFGELTNSTFPGEVTGVLPFFGEWNKVAQATLSYGYGISVTSLQLAQAYAVLANGGLLKPVSLTKLDKAPEGTRVLPEEVTLAVMQMMESVVSRDGTAIKAKIPGYRVAGKTGTSKKTDGRGGYLEKHYLALFAGVAPVSQPRIAAVVVIDDPANGEYYGGAVAAPVFSAVVSEALRLLDVAPDDLQSEPVRVADLSGAR